MARPGFQHHWVGDPAGLLSRWEPANGLPLCLMLSPFAEEQSRCRRLQYDMSAWLGARGLNCCWLDLPGTGDSLMDETLISANIWMAAIHAASAWCNSPGRSLALVGGLRLGGAVAISWLQTQSQRHPIVAIEPISGTYALRALLRSRMAQDGKTAEQLMQRLADGEEIEAAGYPLSQSTRLTLEQFPMDAAPAADVKVIRSSLSDMPPWLQIEPQPAPALADHLAAQILNIYQAAMP